MHDDERSDHSFSTRAHDAFKQGGGRRLLGAAAVALVALVLVIVLGPDQEEIRRRFEYYGAPGELRIMPEVSIDDGSDPVHQIPKSLQQPPPPAEVVVEEEPEDPDAREVLPEPQEGKPVEDTPHEFVDDAEQAAEPQVEFTLPLQSNPDCYILELVRPDYPTAATESDRRMPVITVVAYVWLGEDGQVQDVLIARNDGGPAFGDAVRDAVRQWVFGWRTAPKRMNLVIPFNFRSPYFTPGARGR